MHDPTRRSFFGLGSALLLAACGARTSTAAPRDALVPTAAIADDDDLPPVPADAADACTGAPTAPNIEGPFYKVGAPHRSVLARPSDAGERLVLAGTVRSTRCDPIAGATIDVWQANAAGEYDLDGFRFRGALVTEASGRWELRTVVPGRYRNGARFRPAHIHVKLTAAGYAPLTTQLYFAGDPYNDGDPFIDSSLIMAHTVEAAIRRARFDFVLAA